MFNVHLFSEECEGGGKREVGGGEGGGNCRGRGEFGGNEERLVVK